MSTPADDGEPAEPRRAILPDPLVSAHVPRAIDDRVEPSSRFPIELEPHDPAWAEVASREARRLEGAIGEALIEVHHIGSTAIAGIRAKPIVDLVPVVTSLEALDARREAVEALGWFWRGEFGIAGRRYAVLVDERGRRVSQFHAFAIGTANITRHLAFRDYLRAHPEEARAYEAQKIRARELHPDDVQSYNDAKSPFIRACELRALAWWRPA